MSSKFSKIIICLMFAIISICSLTVPTYCYDSNYNIELVNEFPTNNNFYNLSNISYVKYKNFHIYRTKGLPVFYTSSIEYFSNYSNNQIVYDNYSVTLPNSDFVVNVESSYRFYFRSDGVQLVLLSWDISSLDGYTMSLDTPSSLFLSFHWIPFNILNPNYTYQRCHVYYGFGISYDIDYDNQYYYNDTFCIMSDLSFSSSVSSNISFTNSSGLYKKIKLTDNYSNVYQKQYNILNDQFFYPYIKFTTDSISDIYINHISIDYNSDYSYIGSYQFSGGRLYFNFGFKYITYDNSYPMPLYSANTLGENSNTSPLIPIGSNSYYKTAEWWDIPTHLYNFFIYLIFDAPIISNFTKLVMILISFIVDLFEFIIGLFNGVESLFFVSIFVGVFVLILLLKFIFKG